MKTKAAVLMEIGKPLALRELEIPKLKPGQVLVDIAFSGVCHTQILETRGYRGQDKYIPHCLGHEGSGMVREIGEEAYRYQREVEQGQRVVVGLNRFTTEEPTPFVLHRPDPAVARIAEGELRELRKKRDQRALSLALKELKSVAHDGGNLMPPTLEAIRSLATVGEVCDILRQTFGKWQAPDLP